MLNKRNVIALIRVTKNITFSSNISPACLQTDLRDEESTVKLIVTGWGSISAEREFEFTKTINFDVFL